jgi:hypothetical protein
MAEKLKLVRPWTVVIAVGSWTNSTSRLSGTAHPPRNGGYKWYVEATPQMQTSKRVLQPAYLLGQLAVVTATQCPTSGPLPAVEEEMLAATRQAWNPLESMKAFEDAISCT